MFAFTSMGATIVRSLEGTRGPNLYKICGQVHHRIGSLLPSKDETPKFAEMYIYDTANEVDHRMNAVNVDGTSSGQLQGGAVAVAMAAGSGGGERARARERERAEKGEWVGRE